MTLFKWTTGTQIHIVSHANSYNIDLLNPQFYTDIGVKTTLNLLCELA